VNLVLWFAQVILGLAFFGAGFDQAFVYEDAGRRMAWVAALPKTMAVALGIIEMIGAIGLIVPAWTGVMPWLTPAAASALAVLMAAAILYHVRRSEMPQIAFSATFGIVSAFVAVGRFFIVPF
jgi:uncharacterized membrane protein